MIEQLSKSRWRISCILTGLILVSYFGFLILLGYQKDWMAVLVFPGCSRSILLGSMLILFSWILTGVYVWWCNNHYDHHVTHLRNNPGK